jgi:hypothetical protein
MEKLGIHTYSFAPFTRFELGEREKLVMAASAIQWQKHNGPIALVCDEPFFDFVTREGLDELYVDIQPLPEIPSTINQNSFWAAAKIYSYLLAPVGSFHIDTDVVLNGPIPDAECVLHIAHKDVLESPAGLFHYQATNLSSPPDYQAPHWLRGPHNDWHGYPKSPVSGTGYAMFGFNTSVFCLNNAALLKEYCDASIAFMNNNPCTENLRGWGLMVWAEQVMLMDFAKHNRLSMMEVAKQPNINFLHLQDIKETMVDNPEAWDEFETKMLGLMDGEEKEFLMKWK